MIDISTLNAQFGHTDQLIFESVESGLMVVNINNQHAKARLSLQGGHLLSWGPKGKESVIWLSQDAVFSEGKSIRGGIPICWPWFGAHSLNNSFPAHGYARTLNWKVVKTEVISGGSTFMALQLSQESVLQEYLIADVELELQVTVGEKLEMALITRNSSDEVITIGGALHTYFNVSDIQNVTINGLENQTFIDALDKWQRKKETDPITINSEIDRIYLDTPENDCIIVDAGFKRRIRISKQGSHSTVVWNPWIDKSERMGDMGRDGYKNMICVETTNAADDVIMIEPGDEHRLSVCYEVESL